MNRIIAAMLLAIICILTFAGCGSAAPENTDLSQVSSVSAPETADPEAAIEEIYEDIETMGIEEGTVSVLKDKFDLDPDVLEEFYVRYSNGRFGVADVFILKPDPDQISQVRGTFEAIKLSRTQEFENYDIHNAIQISQNAQIFEQGGYVIMLMLPDNEKARKVIDKYIPKL